MTSNTQPQDTDAVLDELLDVLGDAPAGWRAELEALMQQRELALLSELAEKADKEYSRTEIDNWIFSLGSLAHEELLKRQQIETMKGE